MFSLNLPYELTQPVRLPLIVLIVLVLLALAGANTLFRKYFR